MFIKEKVMTSSLRSILLAVFCSSRYLFYFFWLLFPGFQQHLGSFSTSPKGEFYFFKFPQFFALFLLHERIWNSYIVTNPSDLSYINLQRVTASTGTLFHTPIQFLKYCGYGAPVCQHTINSSIYREGSSFILWQIHFMLVW